MSSCHLRVVEEHDLALIRQWINDPLVFNCIQPRTPLTDPEVREKFLKRPSEMKEIHFLIYSDQKPVGVSSLKGIHLVNRRAEFSIFIGDSGHRGRGVGRWATVETLRFAFEQLNLRRVFLEVYDFNTAAIELYKKVGFTVEGVLRSHSFKNGSYRDLVVMGILKDELRPPTATD